MQVCDPAATFKRASIAATMPIVCPDIIELERFVHRSGWRVTRPATTRSATRAAAAPVN
jgi:hypothetical protein